MTSSNSTDLISIHARTKWTINKWEKAFSEKWLMRSFRDIGFHVFVTKSDAIKYAQGSCRVIVQLEVRNHNASGEYGQYRCETWGKARILKVFTNSGRHDITKRFK